MIPQSILDMLNDATEKATILTALEYIKNECNSHVEFCKGCPFYVDKNGNLSCFFNNGFDGVTPDEWDLEKLEKILKGE